jgi:hypothetical protein
VFSGIIFSQAQKREVIIGRSALSREAQAREFPAKDEQVSRKGAKTQMEETEENGESLFYPLSPVNKFIRRYF